jgi:hypothetical protein
VFGGTKANPVLIVKVCGMGSNFCHNVNRDHGSNSIFFVVSQTHIIQQCYSDKQRTDGSVRCCSEFKKRVPLLPEEAEQFFVLQNRTNKPIIPMDTRLASRPASTCLIDHRTTNQDHRTTNQRSDQAKRKLGGDMKVKHLHKLLLMRCEQTEQQRIRADHHGGRKKRSRKA